MKNKLFDCIDIVENNETCVILEVLPNKQLDLIKLGCFDGDESLLRLTKGDDHTCTVIKNNGESYSWYWGRSGYTLVSDDMSKRGKMIENCITDDFDIYIGSNKDLINKSLKIQSKDDIGNLEHEIEIMYWNRADTDYCVHKDGDYYKHFKRMEDIFDHFDELGFNQQFKDSKVASTGCVVDTYSISKDLEKSIDDIEM